MVYEMRVYTLQPGNRAHAGSMRERFVVLASDLSSYITGEVVSISGGTSCASGYVTECCCGSSASG